LRTASACRKPRLFRWSSRCNARTSPPENHGSRIESGTTDKGLSLRAEPAPDLIRGPAIQEVMDAGSESGMTARRETVIAGSTRNPGSHGSRVGVRHDSQERNCHCGLDPQSRKSWIPGQARDDRFPGQARDDRFPGHARDDRFVDPGGSSPG
jgi:hypothetical protein